MKRSKYCFKCGLLLVKQQEPISYNTLTGKPIFEFCCPSYRPIRRSWLGNILNLEQWNHSSAVRGEK